MKSKKLLIILIVVFAPLALYPKQKLESYKILLKRVGPIKIGYTVRQVERATGRKLSGVVHPDAPDCASYHFKGKDEDKIGLMFIGNKRKTLARIYVNSKKMQTRSGIKIGDSIEKVLKTYGKKIKKEKHKYIDGYYLFYVPRSRRDRKYRINFETDKKKVLSISVGKTPEIYLVEGCS